MTRKLTLEEIGKLAGVSRSTVSRVINDQPDVKEDVRARVLHVIEETGYIPNRAARTLAAKRSGILGLVIPRSVATFFGDPYFSRLTHGITQACYANDYMLSLFLFYSKEEERKLLRHIKERSFLDGVIVQATTDSDPVIPALMKSNMPFLVLGSLSKMDPSLNYIDVDNANGAYAAVSHLIRLGYRRIAHVAGKLDNRPALDRRVGYERALRENDLPVEDDLVVVGDFTVEGGYAAAEQLLPHNPDAIFAASDLMATGTIQAIKDAGLDVPGDISVIGFDDLPPALNASPPLSTVRQPIFRFGVHAVELILDIIKRGSHPPRRVIHGTELVIRESCGAGLKVPVI